MKKIRLFYHLFNIILGFSFLVVFFQNCNAPSTQTDESSLESSGKNSAGTSMASGPGENGNSNLTSGSARSISRTPGSSGSTSSSGAMGGSTVGSSSSSSVYRPTSGGSSGSCIGCSSSGSSGVGGSTSPITGAISLKITKQPVSLTRNEGQDFTVSVSVQGGRSPYNYKWYRNDVELAPVYGSVHYESFIDTMDRIYKDGSYHVVITDGAGTRVSSARALIKMTTRSCAPGKYYIDKTKRTVTSNPSGMDAFFQMFTDMFYFKERKFFVSEHVPTLKALEYRASDLLSHFEEYGHFNIGGTVSNNQNFSISCSTKVPTVHEPQCATNAIESCPRIYYGDNDGYQDPTHTYEGTINFTCLNGYAELKSNTCKLVPKIVSVAPEGS